MDLYLIKVPPEDSDDVLTEAEVVRNVIQQIEFCDNAVSLDLGESWCGLHFILTSGEYPIPKDEAFKRGMKWYDDEENILMGGYPTPYQDSLSFARYLDLKEVTQATKYLFNVSSDKFREEYQRLRDDLLEEKIPPRDWDKGGEWLVGYFEKLVHFYKTALDEGKGILVYAV